MGDITRIASLVPLRLFAGWTLLNTGLSKVSSAWFNGPELVDSVNGWLRDGKPYGFYVPFLRNVVLPHAHLFSVLVSFGELLVGAALLAGLFTRWSALFGLMLVGNFMLARGDGVGANATAPLVVMMLTIILTVPGRVLGLDAALRGKVPRWVS
jgi:thiosulfate dehydrogenase [quinone] large subunit